MLKSLWRNQPLVSDPSQPHYLGTIGDVILPLPPTLPIAFRDGSKGPIIQCCESMLSEHVAKSKKHRNF